MTYINLNNIVDFIGILGFIISIINFVYFFVIRKKKLKIRFEEFGVCKYYNGEVLKIRFCFQNLSQLPVSITRIQLVVNDSMYDCTNSPVNIEEITRRRGTTVIERTTVNSVTVPINLQPLMSQGDYFAFPIPQGIVSNSEKSLTFRIYTNRGKAIQKDIRTTCGCDMPLNSSMMYMLSPTFLDSFKALYPDKIKFLIF